MAGSECFSAHPRPCVRCAFFGTDYGHCSYRGEDNVKVDPVYGTRAKQGSATASRGDEGACGYEGRWFQEYVSFRVRWEKKLGLRD